MPSLSVDEPSQSKNMNDTAALATDPALDLLDIKAAARLLHVAPISMYRLVEKRAIRFYRVCRRLLFKRQDLVEFVERGKTDGIICSNYDRSQNTG
jgi:excisionase family DNA binding protein